MMTWQGFLALSAGKKGVSHSSISEMDQETRNSKPSRIRELTRVGELVRSLDKYTVCLKAF